MCWLYGSGVEKLSGYGEACLFMVNIGLTGRLYALDFRKVMCFRFHKGCVLYFSDRQHALDFLKFVFCLQLMAASSKGVRYAVVCAADKNR